MTPNMDEWLKETIIHSTPEDHGYDTVLWTLTIIVDLLKEKFGILVSDSIVDIHLHRLNLSCQQPCYPVLDQDPVKVEPYLKDEFPKIQELAQEIGADIRYWI